MTQHIAPDNIYDYITYSDRGWIILPWFFMWILTTILEEYGGEVWQ